MKAMIRVGDLPTFSPVPEVIAQRDKVLSECRGIIEIADQLEADYTSKVLADAVSLTRGVEKSRGEVKAPVLELGRAIDAVAKEISGPLGPEVIRLQRLLGGWMDNLRRIQSEAKAKAQAEEAARIAAAAREQDDQKAADMIRAAVQRTNDAVAQAAPPKMTGTGLRSAVTVDVFNPAALYAARPDLVELKPRIAAIKEALLTTKELPGVRVNTAPVATVRTTPHA